MGIYGHRRRRGYTPPIRCIIWGFSGGSMRLIFIVVYALGSLGVSENMVFINNNWDFRGLEWGYDEI